MGQAGAQMVRFGTQGFGYPRWVGGFYPAGTTSGRYLAEYARRLGLVELDTTYYRTPSAELIERWAAATPPDFRFAVKVPKLITQERRLRGVERELDAFITAVRGFGGRLGPLLFQMSPGFQFPDDLPALRDTLTRLPADLRCAVEFRHRAWYRDDVEDLLHQHNVAWVLNDLPYLPRALDAPVYRRLPADFTYVRLVGSHDAPVTDDRLVFDRAADLDAWAALIRGLPDRVRAVYVLANNSYEGHAPATLRRLADRLGLPLAPNLPPPTPPTEPAQPPLPLFDPSLDR